MTTAWLEDDEIECVWLGEGRIEHKPVLRKITIYSRWLHQTVFVQHMRLYIQSWRLAQTHLWAAEGSSPRLCNPVERRLNSANNFHLISCLLAPCLSALWESQISQERSNISFYSLPWYIFISFTDSKKGRRWCSAKEDQRDLHLETQTDPLPSTSALHQPSQLKTNKSKLTHFPSFCLHSNESQ